MIQDQELRELFKAEGEEYLQTLTDSLLRLEAEPGHRATLDEAFRLAHNLKGSARMLGVSTVETVAHRVEDLLDAARHGTATLAAEEFDRLYRGLDALSLLVAEAATGTPAGIEPAQVVALLDGAAPEPTPAHEADSADPPNRDREGAGPDDGRSLTVAVRNEAAQTKAAQPDDEPVLTTGMIEDLELRDLFKAESEEHLQTLDDGLLHLETSPGDPETLAEVFRAAHSLKGSARMLEVQSVEVLAHRFEDRLGAAKSGAEALSADEFDRLYAALDSIRLLMKEATTGVPSGVDPRQVLAVLDGEVAPGESRRPPAPAEHAPPPDPIPVPATPPPPPTPAPAPEQAPPSEIEAVTFIDDPELRNLFREESEEHLQLLDDGLLKLESEPADNETLQEVFRAAHSLKGSARMLSVRPVEALAHRFEDRLGEARNGTAALTPATIDCLYQALIAMRQYVEEAVTGTAASVSLEDVLALFGDEGEAPATAEPAPTAELPGERPKPPPEQPSEEPVSSPAPSAAPEAARPAPVAPARQEPRPSLPERVPAPVPATAAASAEPAAADRDAGHYRIETIRVDPTKLDALMTQSGELVVTNLRVAHRLSDVEALTELVEEWQRELLARRLEGSSQRARATGDSLDRDRRRLEQLAALLAQLGRDSKEDSARLELVTNRLGEGIRTVRMLPLSTVFNLFPRTVRDLSRQQGKEIRLVVEGGDTTADKLLLEGLKDPLMHMVRNAADHGVGSPEDRAKAGKPREATIWLRAYQTPTNIVVEVQDDGRGLNAEKIRRTAQRTGVATEAELAAMSDQQVYGLITRSGLSTSELITDVSGRGVGMDVVHANIEQLKGSLHIHSTPGRGTTFQVRLPLTLATTQVLILLAAGRVYALPVESVQTTVFVSREEIFCLEGRDTVDLNGEPVSLAWLTDLLELPPRTGQTPAEAQRLPCVVLSITGERLALIVEELVDEQEVVLKPHSPILRRVRNVAGSTILETGQVCIVLNPHDLMRSVRKATFGRRRLPAPAEVAQRRRVVLLAEDSLTTRVQMTRILEGAGYEVVAAVDGLDAYAKLGDRDFDALVSDVQMPNLTGLELTEKIRSDSRSEELPIILVTSLAADEDRQRGAEAGANAYITKPAFDQTAFLDTLRRLI